MANRKATIYRADITRVVKGALAAGMLPGRVEVKPDGTVVVYAAGEDPALGAANDWDRP